VKRLLKVPSDPLPTAKQTSVTLRSPRRSSAIALDAPRHQISVRRLAVGAPELAAEVPTRRRPGRGRAGYWSWLLVALVVVAVAHRKLGPSSSATTSTTEWAVPSSAVHARCWSRPPRSSWALTWRVVVEMMGLEPTTPAAN
jgi:hypothetical protein